MKTITITDYFKAYENCIYIYSSLGDVFAGTGSKVDENVSGDRTHINVDIDDRYYSVVKSEIEDRIADIITINYKSRYIKPRIRPAGLNDKERELLLSAIISADLQDDKKYVLRKLYGMENYSVDGIMNFRLKPLKEKWDEVVSYVPKSFGRSELKEFMNYLLDEKKESKVYISRRKVYDNRFRRLIKSILLKEEDLKIVKEIILSCSTKIELDGDLPKDDEYYLKEYFGERISFV